MCIIISKCHTTGAGPQTKNEKPFYHFLSVSSTSMPRVTKKLHISSNHSGEKLFFLNPDSPNANNNGMKKYYYLG